MKCTYTSINVYLEDHDSGDTISDQVCSELQAWPKKKNKRNAVVYTHDENEEIRLVEAFTSDYKKDLVYKVSALVSNQLLLRGRFNIEIEYQVIDMNTQERKNPNKKKYRKRLKKVEKRLMDSLNSLTRWISNSYMECHYEHL